MVVQQRPSQQFKSAADAPPTPIYKLEPPPVGPAPPSEPTGATDGKMVQLAALLEKAYNLHERSMEPAFGGPPLLRIP